MATAGRSIPIAIRWEVIERDDCTCQYCGKKGTFVYRYSKPAVVENPNNIDIREVDFYNGSDVIAFEMDHVVPVSKGGKMSSDNLVLACRYCNRSKGDRDSDG